MPAPRELAQPIQTNPGQKLGCKSSRVGENFRCKFSGVRAGEGWLWMKLIPALMNKVLKMVKKCKIYQNKGS